MGSHHKYQYLLSLCVGIIYWTSNAFTIGLAYEMVPPLMQCRDGEDCSYEKACAQGDYTFRTSSLRNMAYEWSMVCGQQYKCSIIGIANFVGIAIGSVLASWSTNAYGRKKSAFYGMVMQTSGLFAAYFTPSPEIMYLVSFELGVSVGLATVASFNLLIEMTDADHRSWFIGLIYACWSLSSIAQPGMFYLLPDWRDVMLPTAFISTLSFPLLVTLLESVRWVAVHEQDHLETKKCLEAISRFNGRPAISIHLHFASTVETTGPKRWTDLFSSAKMIYRMTALAILQIMMNLGYYGIYFAIPSYFGNIYMNGVFLGLGEIIPFLVSGKVIGKIRRKLSNFVTLFASGVVLLAVLATQQLTCSEDNNCVVRNTVQTIALVLGIFLVSSFCVAIAVLSSEAFNSHLRTTAAGILNAAARIGGSIATLLLLIYTNFGIPPLAIIGVSALASSLLIFTLPETLGRDMESF